ncbi:hypothetical protein NDK47_10155 [Brevibacillus ruminantium]|uniref:Biopolymer transporter Tol n=1 Tax=Brevibacillus ruminantium TaxID=2950604 RepID=A0ABY4WKN7_9BACL|nr:hypothetical protein [Brevibacillus ruminantium]USG67608.1 hypothetical protein NDK47_10155 [Brevibacillus ruminantium]
MWKPVSILTSVALAATALLGSSGSSGAAERIQKPERVYQEAIPAQIAFTNNRQLWLLNARDPQAAPKQVTSIGAVEIVGWSQDGAWLFYQHEPKPEETFSKKYLWAVKADGTDAFQIDPREVLMQPKWAPAGHRFAYVVQSAETGSTGTSNVYSPELVAAELTDGKITKLLEEKRDITDFAWMPDSARLLLSVPAAKDRPITLELTDLKGKKLSAYPLGQPPKIEEGIYPYAATGLTLSPDGNQVAYYVRPNSGSLTADGVAIQLLDLTKPSQKPFELGTGLSYPEWFSWSADSKQLAFIEGGGRVASEGKHLTLAKADGKVIPAGQTGKVDALPRWTNAKADRLFFARGLDNSEWLGNYQPEKLLIPGQRIWTRDAGGQEQAVTKGTEKTADTYPNPSPDGNQLLFVRLDGAEHGSVCVRTQDGSEKELVRHVTGEAGYYANYLPAWVQIHWVQPQ